MVGKGIALKNTKFVALLVLGFFMSGCAQMSYKQKSALKAAAACAVVGATIGGASASASDHKNRHGIGIGIGVATGALICGPLAYFLAEEPKAATEDKVLKGARLLFREEDPL